MADDDSREVAARRAKAEEFLSVAELALDLEAWSAATSLAASAATQASDVLQLLAGLRPPKGRDHHLALKPLRMAAGQTSSQQFGFILGLKSAAQYDSQATSESDAREAIKRATRLVQKSKGIP